MDQMEQGKLDKIYELVHLLTETYLDQEMAKLSPQEQDLVEEWPADMIMAYIFHRDSIKEAAGEHWEML